MWPTPSVNRRARLRRIVTRTPDALSFESLLADRDFVAAGAQTPRRRNLRCDRCEQRGDAGFVICDSQGRTRNDDGTGVRDDATICPEVCARARREQEAHAHALTGPPPQGVLWLIKVRQVGDELLQYGPRRRFVQRVVVFTRGGRRRSAACCQALSADSRASLLPFAVPHATAERDRARH